MASQLSSRSGALSVLVVLLTLQAFVTHSTARPLTTKTTAQDDVMTSAEMQRRYVRPEGAVEAEITGTDGEHGRVVQWDRKGWNEGGGWDEAGNWDKGGGWTNRPPWAKPDPAAKTKTQKS